MPLGSLQRTMTRGGLALALLLCTLIVVGVADTWLVLVPLGGAVGAVGWLARREGYLIAREDLGLTGVGLDDLKRAAERYAALHRTVADAHLVFDPRGRVTELSLGAIELLGTARSGSVGRPLTNLMTRDDGLSGWPPEGQMLTTALTGRPLEATFVPLADETLVVLRDLSEQEAALDEAHTAREDARRAAIGQAEFLANMSHEIRTPMNGILGMLTILRDESLTAEQAERVGHIQRSATALLAIVNDLLDISRLNSGAPIVLEELAFDPLTLIEDVCVLLAETRRDPRVSLVIDAPADLRRALRGDAGRVRQVVNNLVSNALKFTRRGHVMVRLSTRTEGDEVELIVDVDDTGIGIAAADHELIFERFRQADGSMSRNFGGTGLGLAIARDLARLLGGDISLRSEPGQGAAFTFTSTMRLDHARAPERPDLHGANVLIATINAVEGHAIARNLRGHGATCEVVTSTPALLAGLQGRDAVLADTALVSDAKRRGITLQVPVIGLVWRSVDISTRAGSELSAQLHKPVRLSRCSEQLRTALQDVPGLGQRPGIKVLLVEDDPLNRLVASKMLNDLGCVVELADDGLTGLDKARRGDFDVILMDCQLPGLDGFEVTRRMRALGGPRADVPIIALTAHTMSEDIARCRDAGMNDHLAKPVSRSQLGDTLRRWSHAAGRFE